MDSKQNLISLSKQILEQINTHILKDNQPNIVQEGFEWLRESLSLLAKQSSLFESSLILLEKNKEEEAFVLTRSQFNNALWINYLCKDENGERFKEYTYEPTKYQIRQLINARKYIMGLPEEPQYKDFPTLLDSINHKITECKQYLKSEGISNKNLKTKSIYDLSKEDLTLWGMYLSFYFNASKFEHADISTVANFREQIMDEYSINDVFRFNMSKSNESLWKVVFRWAIQILYTTIDVLYKRIKILNIISEETFYSLIIYLKTALDMTDR